MGQGNVLWEKKDNVGNYQKCKGDFYKKIEGRRKWQQENYI